MPSSAPLVSGYDSDSDHSENDTGPSSSSIAAPRSSGPATSSSGTFGLKLPPPSNTNTNMARPAAKRKADQRLQIKIDALDEEEGKEATPQMKRPTMDKASSSSSHGLFGLLPAPSQKPTKPDVKTNAATAAAAAADIAEGVGAQEDEQPNKRAKGNNDFRAMLGLTPSAATKAKRPSPAPSPLPSSSKEKLPEASLKSSQGKGTGSESAQQAVRDRQGSGETTDFFSFSNEPGAKRKKASTASFTVSAAPQLQERLAEPVETDEGDEDRYRGWQQDPDGTWVPVTPEAHAVYAAWAASQGNQGNGVDMTDVPAGVDTEALHSVDAASLAREAWQNRPATTSAALPGSDARYAAAAATAGQGGQQQQQQQGAAQDDEAKMRDRLTNYRAQKRGQLSSLLVQAEENRERLEERWSRGKSARGEAKAKYGF